jgi:hypothetical protein
MIFQQHIFSNQMHEKSLIHCIGCIGKKIYDPYLIDYYVDVGKCYKKTVY